MTGAKNLSEAVKIAANAVPDTLSKRFMAFGKMKLIEMDAQEKSNKV